MYWLKTFIQGMFVGLANIIPGFSGGTIAYMFGIYDKLLEAISDYVPNKNKKRGEYTLFLGLIALGAAIAILAFSGVMEIIIDTPSLKQHFYFFIIGAIIGSISIVALYEEDMALSFKRLLIMILTIVAFIYIFYYLKVGENKYEPEVTNKILGFIAISKFDFIYYMKLLLIGIVAAGSMILPGFSGSALLVSLGEYENIIRFLDIDNLMVFPLFFFGIGCLLGILLLSKVLTVLLNKFRGETTYFIMGLMLASIVQLIKSLNGIMYSQIIISIIALMLGFFLAYGIAKKGEVK